MKVIITVTWAEVLNHCQNLGKFFEDHGLAGDAMHGCGYNEEFEITLEEATSWGLISLPIEH